MAQAVDSGGATRSVKREQKIRNEVIKKATEALNDKKITVMEFLVRVTCKREKCIISMAHFEGSTGNTSESSDDDDSAGSSNILVQERVDDEGICIICADEKSCVVFLPCRHMKSCKSCSSEIAARAEGAFHCPFCKQIVQDTMVVFT